ncbi:MAG: hypothetical protein RLZZ106_1356 [Cyanobacteriota bacterium]|jgi:hypothetical protein
MRAPRETRLRLGPDLAGEVHKLASELQLPPADLGRLLLRGGLALLDAPGADRGTTLRGLADHPSG